MRTANGDKLLVALLAVGLAGLAATGVVVFRRAAAKTGPVSLPEAPPADAPRAGARASAPGDASLAAATGGLVTQARKFKVAGARPEDAPAPDYSNPANVRAAFLEQQAVDRRVEHSVRETLGKMGPTADVED